MKLGLKYLFIPIIFSLVVAVYAATKIERDFISGIYVFLNSVLFYCAPYVVFFVLESAFKFSAIVSHSGYIAATIARIVISLFWLLPPDPSGLPIQWMMYWPLAGILIIIFAGSSGVYNKHCNS